MNKYIKLTCACLAASLMLTSCVGAGGSRLMMPPAAAISAVPLPVKMPEPSNMPFLSGEPRTLKTSIGQISDIDLTIPAKLNITKPDGKITATTAKYFIMGTSNPDMPVYLGDTEIQRLGSEGTFGVYVDLQMGDNTFKFSQGNESQTVTITRKNYVSAEHIPIKEINQSSMIPAVFSGVKSGESLAVGCTAPAGATVTAYFDGKSTELKPVSTDKKTGLPVVYKGSIPVEEDVGDITWNAGKVTYKLSYNGAVKTYESSGDVYVAGENSAVAVKVKSYMGFVYPDIKNLSVFREKLKMGAVDYIKAQDNTYVELSSGGYVPKEQLEVVEGEVSVRSKLGKVKFSQKNKGESYVFACTGTPAYVTRLSDGKFSMTLFNTTGASGADVSNSSLFSSVEVAQGETYATYTFTLKNQGKLWGYNVNYGENSVVLSFQYKPVLGSEARPFEGMTIVIDPGHGGTDNGAIGFSGVNGPTETDVNLAHAYAVRDLLASMGANVVLTRSEDIYYSLDDRLKASEEVKADLFVSIHHNSIAEGTDGNKVAGVEVYYHNGLSKSLAQNMMASVTGELGRTNRFVMQSYYRVTLSPYAPSILLELGFMSNPVEYERAAREGQVSKAARAIVNGIKRTLS